VPQLLARAARRALSHGKFSSSSSSTCSTSSPQRPSCSSCSATSSWEVWEASIGHQWEEAAILERRTAELERKKERLDEVFIFEGSISRDVYDRQGRRLGEEIQQTRIALAQARASISDPRPLVEFAVRVLSSAGGCGDPPTLSAASGSRGHSSPPGWYTAGHFEPL
jgi:hypothetical protein